MMAAVGLVPLETCWRRRSAMCVEPLVEVFSAKSDLLGLVNNWVFALTLSFSCSPTAGVAARGSVLLLRSKDQG